MEVAKMLQNHSAQTSGRQFVFSITATLASESSVPL